MRKATGPAVKTLADVIEVNTFKESAKVVVVGYFDQAEGTEFSALSAAAVSDDDLTYGFTSDAAAAKGARV